MRGPYRIAHAAALAAAKVEAAEVPPEAMLIVTVDEGYGDLSCHGNPQLTARPARRDEASWSLRVTRRLRYLDPPDEKLPASRQPQTHRYCGR